MEQQSPLAGKRIFLFEDSPVIAEFTCDVLDDLGCTVVGPAPNLAAAREMVETEEFDAALMDVRIRGDRSFAICEMLDAKGIPFVFTSGYADWQLPEKWQERPRLQKPYTIDQVQEALEGLLS
jgi:CheY-like chemotaxis protein